MDRPTFATTIRPARAPDSRLDREKQFGAFFRDEGEGRRRLCQSAGAEIGAYLSDLIRSNEDLGTSEFVPSLWFLETKWGSSDSVIATMGEVLDPWRPWIDIRASDFLGAGVMDELLGASPGYGGYSDGGLLTEWVRRYPNAFVSVRGLGDSLELSFEGLARTLYSILKGGHTQNSAGGGVSFRRTMVCLSTVVDLPANPDGHSWTRLEFGNWWAPKYRSVPCAEDLPEFVGELVTL